MGNLRCKNCGEEYSSREKRCPGCGEKKPAGGKRVKKSKGSAAKIIAAAVLVILVVIVVILLLKVLGGRPAETTPPDTLPATGQEDITTPPDSTQTPDDTQPDQPGQTAEPDAAQPALESIAVDITNVTLRDDAGTVQLHANTYPENAGVTVLWASSDPLVAVVDEKGFVTGIGVGTCEIYAYSEDKIAVCTVESYVTNGVIPDGSIDDGGVTPDAGSLEIKSIFSSNVLTDFTMKVGETVPLNLYNNGSKVSEGVSWASDGGSVTVDESGKATGVSSTGSGSATITASYGGSTVSVIVRVK